MTKQLSFKFLGPPEVSYQGQPLQFRSRKVLALLIYLVVEGGWHSRESLMTLLWPESDQKRAGMSLRSTMARLRRTLADAGEFIITEPGQIGFDFQQPFELDLRLVEAAAHPDAPSHAWQAALAADRGAFLAGFFVADAPDFEQWATLQREIWQRHLETVYERLARWQLTAGDHRQAVATAARWILCAPYSETAYRHLMEAHFLADDRSTALQVYERCVRMLDDELGVAPAADTLALAERIRTTSPPGQPPEASGEPSPLAELPLVGRAAEHSQLASLYQQVGRGATQVAVVIGEAGMGKTRLARAFVRWASLETPGADVLQGGAFEVGGRLPYQSLVEALRARLEAENAPEDLLADVWLAELSQLLPELRDRYPDLPPAMSGEPDFIRSRIFEAVARVVEALATRQPVVLFVDDIQWADEGTLDLLLYLSRRWAQDQTPVLLLLTARQEDLTTTVSLGDWLDSLGRDVSLTRLRLPALTPAAVQQLMGILAGQGSGDDLDERAVVLEFGAWLQAETGGVPFFMEALLQMLIEQGVLTRRQEQGRPYLDVVAAWQHIQGERRLPVPPGAREVILNRLGRLTDPARALLLAAAVIGRACSFERLCQVSDLAEMEALAALEELLNSRLMLEMGDELRPYNFAHDHIRQVVYTEAGEARRRLYHRRALAALTEGQGAPSELAYHALAARLAEPAFRHSVAAGDEAMRLSATSEAVAHYENARRLLHDTPALEVEIDLIQLLYSRLGRARELQHRFQDALAVYGEMESLAKSSKSRSLELAALVAQGTIHALPYAGHDIVRAQVVADQALTLARQIEDPAAEAKILWNYLLLHAYGTGDSAQAITYGEASVKIARESNLREQLAFTLNDLGMAYMTEGQHAAAECAFKEAESVLRDLDNRSMLGNSLNFLALLHLWQGEFDKALAYWDDCEVVTEVLGSSNNYPFVAVNRSLVFVQTGQFDRLLTRLEPVLRMDEASLQPLAHVHAYRLLALNQAALGAYEQGVAYCRQAISFHPRIPAYLRPSTFAILARLFLGQGDLARAQGAVAESLVDFEPDNFSLAGLAYLDVPLAQAKVALAAGDASQVTGSLDYVFACYKRLNSTIGKVEAWYLQGKAAMSKGKTAAAYEALQAGRSLAETIGNRTDLWPIVWELSQLEAAAGNTHEAERLRQQAREIVTYIANHTGSDELSASFRALPEIQAILSPS